MTTASSDKAVILAGGVGSRMRKQDGQAALSQEQASIAETGMKGFIPTGRPFLDYVLTSLADAGYRRVCLITGPDHHEMREYYGETLKYERLEVSFAIQDEPLGTANAVLAAETFAADDPFLVINSDNHYPHEALEALRKLERNALAVFDRDAMIAGSNIPADRISRFAVVETDEKGFMRRILEKPDAATLARLPEPIGVSMNCWLFEKPVFEACRRIDKSPRGEYELPDAAQYMIDQMGLAFQCLNFKAPVLDLTSRADVGPVTRMLAGKEVRV